MAKKRKRAKREAPPVVGQDVWLKGQLLIRVDEASLELKAGTKGRVIELGVMIKSGKATSAARVAWDLPKPRQGQIAKKWILIKELSTKVLQRDLFEDN